MFILNRILLILCLVFFVFQNTVNATLAQCLLLKAEFIEGQQPYSYNERTGKLAINIKVNVRHKDQTLTSTLLKKTIDIDISEVINWDDLPTIISNAVMGEMMAIAQAECSKKECGK